MEQTTKTSPLFSARLSAVKENLAAVREAIKSKNFQALGEVAEYDSLLMHATMMTTRPPLLYWSPATMGVIQVVEGLREEGVPVYYTIDAGANVHVLTLPAHVKKVETTLRSTDGVQTVLHCRPGDGAHLVPEHLF